MQPGLGSGPAGLGWHARAQPAPGAAARGRCRMRDPGSAKRDAGSGMRDAG